MKIEHNEICLRDVTAADCKQLGKWWNDGSIMAHAGFPNGLGTTGELKEKKETALSMAEEGMDVKMIARLVKVSESDVKKWIDENLCAVK